jgi:3'-phosphoadenosine 5'-phosphosulfate (PAPS) 3'-phosphatase
VNYPLDDLPDDVDFRWLEEIVQAAGDIALKHFRQVTTARKADNTVVTIADREVEAFLRDALLQAFPADSLLGEELGAQLSEGTAGVYGPSTQLMARLPTPPGCRCGGCRWESCKTGNQWPEYSTCRC